MLKIAIADDEPAARRRLRRLLADEEGCIVVGEFSDGQSAIDGILRIRPDVALLDIQMPEHDGLEVAAAVSRAGSPAIVFVTAFDQYALRAFQVHAVDYLVKPVDAARLRETLARIQSRRVDSDRPQVDAEQLMRLVAELRLAHASMTSGAPPRWRDRLLGTVDGRSMLVPCADLDWIEAAGNYVRLHRGAHILMLRESLASVEANLDPHVFARIHRGTIVNIARIKEVQPWFSGAAILILASGQRLTVSRSYRKAFEGRFGIPSEP